MRHLYLAPVSGHVARLCGGSTCCTDSRVARALLVLGTFLFQGRGQSNQFFVVVGALLVPLAGRLLVRVQVYHIGGTWGNCSICRTFYKIGYLEHLKIQFFRVRTLIEYCIFHALSKILGIDGDNFPDRARRTRMTMTTMTTMTMTIMIMITTMTM